MLDLHCHIAYGLDDGAESLDMAVEMAVLAYESGSEGIVATPHCNIEGSYQNYWSNDILERIKILRQAVNEIGVRIKIFCGQEIFCTPDVPDLLKSGRLITLNNTKYPLVEFGFNEHSSYVYPMLEKLVSLGYTPVVAHPERYLFVSEEIDAAKRMKDIGCLLQVNKGSILKKFGSIPYFNSKNILSDGLADIVASDAHSHYSRTPVLADAYEYVSEFFSPDYSHLLFEKNPALILQNKATLTY